MEEFYIVNLTPLHPRYDSWKNDKGVVLIEKNTYNEPEKAGWYELISKDPMDFETACKTLKTLMKTSEVTLHDNLYDVKQQLFDAPLDIKSAFNSILRYFTDSPENFQAQEAGGDIDKSGHDKNAEDNSEETDPSGDSSTEDNNESDKTPDVKTDKNYVDPKSVKGGFNKIITIIKNNKGKTIGEFKNDLTENGFEVRLSDKKIEITGNDAGTINLDKDQLNELEIK